jgi:hypothetical protein
MQSIALIIEARWALPMDGTALPEHAALAPGAAA